tara:strand:+ start:178 stop:951 length:774 start_codon:yes stop_codon:yes gene_type:complete
VIELPLFRSTQIMQRTLNPAAFNRIANDPAVRSWLGGDGIADLTDMVSEPANVALMSEAGGFVCVNHGAGRYEVHSLFSPKRSKQAAIRAMRDGLAYMFTLTPCVELLTKVPIDNLAAKGLARLAGFSFQFERLAAWTTDSEKLTAFYSLTIEKWALFSQEAKSMGKWFHGCFVSLLTNNQHPVYFEDSGYLAMVGAAMGMLQAGFLWKAVLFYNRWALWTCRKTVVVENECPLIVSFDRLIIKIMHSHVEVLSCQH